MDDSQQVVGINTVTLLEQLGKAFLDLEVCTNHAANNHLLWIEIEAHFRNLDTMLKKKTEELEAMEKDFEAKESLTCTMLTEREAAITATEKDLLDRVQELKDAAVADMAEAREKYHPISLYPLDDGPTIETKVSSSLGVRSAIVKAKQEQCLHKTGEHAEGVSVKVKPLPELVKYCEQMDANGLLKFTLENKNILSVIRDELSVALESATEPPRLVLDSLEGFYPHDESPYSVDPNDASLQGMRQSCITIMEAMATLFARAGPGVVHFLSPDIKHKAMAIADEWNLKLANADNDSTVNNSLEAAAFLQLLASFKIASEFDEEELCKYIFVAAGNAQTPQLCHSLGLTRKVPGIIEVWINSGKEVEAVHLAQAVHLSESYPPVPLLKTYLKEVRRNSQGNGSVEGGQTDVNEKELVAVNAVINCVKKYKLEADYPLDPLQRRAVQLERAKSDRKRPGDSSRRESKRPGDSSRRESKRPRSNGRGFSGFRGHERAIDAAPNRYAPVYGERASAYMGFSERYAPTQVAPNAYTNQIPNQSSYPQPSGDQRAYYYPQPQDDIVAPTSYNAAVPSNYGSYIGGGLQQANQPFM